MREDDSYLNVGDRVRFRAHKPISPYGLPTANREEVLCTAELIALEQDAGSGTDLWWGTVASIEPVEEHDKYDTTGFNPSGWYWFRPGIRVRRFLIAGPYQWRIPIGRRRSLYVPRRGPYLP